MGAKNRSTNSRRRILLIDDHPVVRHGLIELINREPDLTVCGEADDVQTALSAVQALTPDMAIVDISLKATNGVEFIKSARLLNPQLLILVLSVHDEMLYAERALRAGARGYVMKQEATDHLINAVRRVFAGEISVSERMVCRLLKLMAGGAADGGPASSLRILSDRELQIYELIGSGVTTRQIAKKLNLGIKTVETHRAHIKEKLDLKTATELMQHAVHWVQSQVPAAQPPA